MIKNTGRVIKYSFKNIEESPVYIVLPKIFAP